MKKIVKRYLVIENFKNIGIRNPEKILVNYDFDNPGNLVILVGPNNSGKSNILEAFSRFAERNNFTDSDYPLVNLTNGKEKYPKIKFQYEWMDDSSNEQKYFNTYYSDYHDPVIDFNVQKDDFLKEIEVFEEFISKNKNIYFNELLEDWEIYKTLIDEDENQKISDILEFYDDIHIDECITRTIKDNLIKLTPNLWEHYYSKNPNNYKLYENDVIPDIITYKEIEIKQLELSVNVNNISSSNNIWNKILSFLSISDDVILNYYKEYELTKNKGLFQKLEEKINEGLRKVSKDFNRIYSFDNEKYNFKCRVESNYEMDLYIQRNDENITLNYQSTGFKWFFNFYFNKLLTSNLKKGDILVMDEPAVHLHVQGQREFRKFLKRFANENQISIIISTHSPFLIDIDYLEEIRVISSEDQHVKIHNKFHIIDGDDTDIIENIKKALTINNNILFSKDSKIFFVEGITDYNYLTKFKNLNRFKDKYKNLHFFPINGIGSKDDIEHKNNILKKINDISYDKAFLLVDSDKVGKLFKESLTSNNQSKIILLDEAINKNNQKIHEIESLFKSLENDKVKKYIKNKSFESSCCFKYNIQESEIDNNTKNLMQELLDFLKTC